MTAKRNWKHLVYAVVVVFIAVCALPCAAQEQPPAPEQEQPPAQVQEKEPAPAPDHAPAQETFYRTEIKEGHLNVRDAASIEGGIVRTLLRYECAKSLGETAEADDYSWVRVEDVYGKKGWAADEFLLEDPACAAAFVLGSTLNAAAQGMLSQLPDEKLGDDQQSRDLVKKTLADWLQGKVAETVDMTAYFLDSGDESPHTVSGAEFTDDVSFEFMYSLGGESARAAWDKYLMYAGVSGEGDVILRVSSVFAAGPSHVMDWFFALDGDSPVLYAVREYIESGEGE